MSPGACQVVCIYLEIRGNFVDFQNEFKWCCKIMIQRWVDDIMVLVCSWNLTDVDFALPKRRVVRFVNLTCVGGLSLKVEDPSIFVGLAMHVTDDKVGCSVHSLNSCEDDRVDLVRPRFQHWCTNTSVKVKLATIQGQIIRILDSTPSSSSYEPSLLVMYVELLALSYPRRAVQLAISRVLRTHPYLNGIGTIFTRASSILSCR